MSLNGRNQDIQACTHLIWKGWKRQWNLLKENRFILRWIWMYWYSSVFPGTGTPEPGGIDYMTLQRAVIAVCQNVCLVGRDVNELCPPYDASGVSTGCGM